jgi:hypothetical protein
MIRSLLRFIKAAETSAFPRDFKWRLTASPPEAAEDGEDNKMVCLLENENAKIVILIIF